VGPAVTRPSHRGCIPPASGLDSILSGLHSVDIGVAFLPSSWKHRLARAAEVANARYLSSTLYLPGRPVDNFCSKQVIQRVLIASRRY